MQKKYFKCYYCKTSNSFFVPKEQKGKKCRCCDAYNYFFNNNNNKKKSYYHNTNTNYKNNNNNYKSHNNNYHNNYNKNIHKKKYNRYKKPNLNTNINQESSSNRIFFSRNNNNPFNNNVNISNNPINNDFPSLINLNNRIQGPFFNNNIYNYMGLNNNNQLNNNNNYNFFQNFNVINNSNNYLNNLNNCPLRNIFNTNHTPNNNIINNNNYLNNRNLLVNNSSEINEDSEEDNKENNNSTIKYSWLKKEKYTEEIMNKKENGFECTICLENIKLNQDINILKCSHIFHYKCIENLVDHNFNSCPNCRCDLKTGEKQPKNPNNELNANDRIMLYEFINEIRNYSLDQDNSFNESDIDINSENDFEDEENFI